VDDETLGRLVHLNYLAFGRESTLWGEGAEVLDAGGVLCLGSGADFPFVLNGVFRTDPALPPADVLARADAFFDRWGRGYTVVTGPGDEDLAAHVEAEGLWSFGTTPEMVCRARLADVEPPAGVELHEATSEADLADFLAVVGPAYQSLGMPAEVLPAAINRLERLLEPHIVTVVARLEGEPVAAAQAMLSHGVAGVFWVGTLEAARGRGLGEAVARWVTNWAFDHGAAAQSLEASTMGEPVYARMGYETLHRYTSWFRSAER
jgi:GNAT superfamily N-acetyltransferase